MLKLVQWIFVAALCSRATLAQNCDLSCSCSSVCCLNVTENSAPGTFVGLATTEPTLRIAFQTEPNGEFDDLSVEEFMISSTGEITVAENAILDAEGDNCISFLVGVSGRLSLLFGIVVLDENDNPPVFMETNPIQISIPETTDESPGLDCNSLRSTLINLRAMDVDMTPEYSEIIYSIPDSETFSIAEPNDDDEGIPCISNGNIELDRDSENYVDYNFTLVASNTDNTQSSNITVIVSLAGVNEFTPMLPAINDGNNLFVLENRSMGYEIHRFAAVDNDQFDEPQEFRYEITSVLGDTCLFIIDQTSGSLQVNGELDAEDFPNLCSFQVRVTDMQGLSGTISVNVHIQDVNERAVIPSSVNDLNLIENVLPMMSVGAFFVRDSDIEFNNNTFDIVSGSDYFSIVPSVPPVFRITQTRMLDRENFTGEDLVIRIIERGIPTFSDQELSYVINVLDVNDNAPTLNIPSLEITEGQGFQRRMLGAMVEDLDLGENATVKQIEIISAAGDIDLTDRFIDENNQSPFLGPMGTLLVPVIDREVDGRVITINVNITDNGNPPQSGLSTFTLTVLDINDNTPQFQLSEYTFNISENTPPGIVGTVLATDLDEGANGDVTYSLESEFFEISSIPGLGNNMNGEIRSLMEFDREKMDQYTLTINARDNEDKNTVSVTVYINIIDKDDNPPMFEIPNTETFNVVINSPVGTHVGTVLATDPDIEENAEIVYSLTDTTLVSINSTTGSITLQEVPVDEASFNLTVTLTPRRGNQTSVSKQIVIVIVPSSALTQVQIIIIGVVGPFVLIVLLLFCIITLCYCSQRKNGNYKVTKEEDLNNQPERINSFAKPILKSVPAAAPTNGSISNRERVQVKFSDLVDETHYDRQGAVMGDKVLRKASITNFGSSDESPQVPSRGSPVHNGVLSAGAMPVMDYEQSPGPLMNGITNDYTGLQRYEMHQIPQHSPLRLRQGISDHTDYSQGTGSTTDVNSYNSDGEEESTFSDGASNMNTSIPCFKDDHRYGPPPSHPPHYLPVHHSPHMSSSNGLIGVIHPGNMSSLAAEGMYRSSQSNGYPNRHSQNNHHSLSDTSSQSTTPSPHPRHEILNRMDPPSMRPKHPLANGHSYPRGPPPLVMPDAYPIGGLPDMHHREVISRDLSLSDFGEASTYASTELDEALNINYEPEPGFYSLTATDYDEHDN